MNWSLSIRIQPGEEVFEKSHEARTFSLSGMYVTILTNRRAIFKFNSIATTLVQSFPYDEITAAQPANRLLVKYLKLTVKGKDYFMNVEDPDAWGEKIMAAKEKFAVTAPPPAPLGTGRSMPSLADLIGMLETLKEFGLLTEEELAEKKKKITT